MEIPSDQNKVDSNNLGELLWWCAHLGTGPELLLHAVTDAGPEIDRVRNYLRLRCIVSENNKAAQAVDRQTKNKNRIVILP